MNADDRARLAAWYRLPDVMAVFRDGNHLFSTFTRWRWCRGCPHSPRSKEVEP